MDDDDRCDGTEDCYDGSDEDGCSGTLRSVPRALWRILACGAELCVCGVQGFLGGTPALCPLIVAVFLSYG